MKKTILTITLNPALDKSSRVAGIVPEKKLRCEQPKYEPGGGGINVSRALYRLGVDSCAFFLAGGDAGRHLLRLVEQENIACIAQEVAGETRENVIIVDSDSNQQFRFGFPGQALSAAERQEIATALELILPTYSFVVISGSLPAGTGTDFLVDLIRQCKKAGARVVLDSSGEALAAGVKEGVYLVKPNRGELASLSGMEDVAEDAMHQAAEELLKAGGAEIVAVSLGGRGAAIYSAEAHALLKAPEVEVKSTVGAGDSMVAGMVAALAEQRSLRDVLALGIACGSATTMSEGTGLFKKENVDRLLAQIDA